MIQQINFFLGILTMCETTVLTPSKWAVSKFWTAPLSLTTNKTNTPQAWNSTTRTCPCTFLIFHPEWTTTTKAGCGVGSGFYLATMAAARVLQWAGLSRSGGCCQELHPLCRRVRVACSNTTGSWGRLAPWKRNVPTSVCHDFKEEKCIHTSEDHEASEIHLLFITQLPY